MKIAIIGASSQVGSSLAYYLKHFTGDQPVCFIRSSYSAVFFKVLEIEYRITETYNWLKKDFEDIDVVIDCTYPSGQLYEIKNALDVQLNSLFSALRPGTTFIYLSTIMAFGMPDGYNRVKYFSIPRSTYAYLKRFAEKKVKTLSGKYNIPAYNFRLGQVHGFLQSVNSSYREKLSYEQPIVLDGNPGDLVNVIFINTLADAVRKAATKQILPGTYSLVNQPQWTLLQLYQYYKEYYSLQNQITFVNKAKITLTQKIKNSLVNILKSYRPLFESFLLIKNKKWYAKVKGKYRVLNMKGDGTLSHQSPFTDFHLLGKNPGNLINGLACSHEIVFEQEKRMEEKYNELLLINTVEHS